MYNLCVEVWEQTKDELNIQLCVEKNKYTGTLFVHMYSIS